LTLAFPVLVGDIGGTNARFAIIEDSNSTARRFEPVRIGEFENIEEAIQACVLDKTSIAPASMMLAIATPLVGDVFRLTNADWTIDPRSILKRFGLDTLVLVNDFAAQGLAALALGEADMVDIGDSRPVEGHTKVVIGPGTGLGIAIVTQVDGKWTILPGEGGHIDLGPRTEREFEIWPHLEKQNGRLSGELALSGRGLVNLYRGICRLDGLVPRYDDAADISQAGMSDGSGPAREAVDLFLTLLARICGDMALITLADGGIYIAGGIAGKLLPAIDKARFRAEFENKAPHEDIMRKMAIRVMTHPLAALEGLSACAAKPAMFSLEGSARIFRNG
jgi:glucokinase